MAETTAQEDSLQKGVAFITAQDTIYQRNGWLYRWSGWICGWGSAALAAFAGVASTLIDGESHAHIWAGLIAGVLGAVNQTVKFEMWADAYYRGHLLLETALGDHALGTATAADLSAAWRKAEGGLPGGASRDASAPKAP